MKRFNWLTFFVMSVLGTAMALFIAIELLKKPYSDLFCWPWAILCGSLGAFLLAWEEGK
jgi:hypothetical protein